MPSLVSEILTPMIVFAYHGRMAPVTPLEPLAVDWDRYRRDDRYARRVQARQEREDDRRPWPPIIRLRDALSKISGERLARVGPPAVGWFPVPTTYGEMVRFDELRMEEGRRREDAADAFMEFTIRVQERTSIGMSEREFLAVMEREAAFWRDDPAVCRLVERCADELRQPAAPSSRSAVLPFSAPR